jgi:glutathione reductase (NADPH)
MTEYDLFVIGTGMSGVTIATKCSKKGLKVGIADFRPFGGTCALRGCDPKKILLDVAKAQKDAQKYEGKGLQGDYKINWPELAKFMRGFTDPMPRKMEKGYLDAGVITYHEAATFTGTNTLRVGNETIKAGKIVIATGARPRTLDIPGAELTLESNDIFELDELPESITFLGGGYVAFEFAHLAAMAGARVTIIDRGDRPLKHFDADLVKHIVNASREYGIKILTGTEATEVKKSGDGLQVVARSYQGEEFIESKVVVNAAGRVPEIDLLDLEIGQVSFGKKGVQVNEYLQSVSNPDVYAAGDVADSEGLPLTPVAIYEGHAVASNILKGNNKIPSYPEMPTVVFTIPEIAQVGLTEEQARVKNIDFKINSGDASGWFNAYRSQSEAYAYKVLVSEQDGTIVGAHLVGPSAAETINLFAIAIKGKMTAKDLKSMVYSYPSWASDVGHMV